MIYRPVPPAPSVQSPKLEDVLGSEMQKNQKLKRIKSKYGLPEKPQTLPRTQWVGDNNS